MRAARFRMPELDDPPVLGDSACGCALVPDLQLWRSPVRVVGLRQRRGFCPRQLLLLLTGLGSFLRFALGFGPPRLSQRTPRRPACVCSNFSLHDCRCSTASGTFLAGSSGMGHCRLRSSAVLSSPFSSSSCSFWLIDLQVSHGSNSCSGPPTCVRHFLERLLTTFQ